MADRAQLEQTLNERGVAFDYYASDDTLERLVRQSAELVYDPDLGTLDRGRCEQYLQGRRIAYDASASDDELRTIVLTQQDADHARFLASYDPIVTRLPASVGTSPEQPEPRADDTSAADEPYSSDSAQAPSDEHPESTDDPPQA